MGQDQCPFCDRAQLEEWLITETANFSVVASLGQVVPGYTLVIPKRHVACFAELSTLELAEFVLLERQLVIATVGVYGQLPACFEHGRSGQTVGHAHAHFIPIAEDVALAMLSRVIRDYRRVHWFPGWASFAAARDRFPSYLFLGGLGGVLVFPTDGVEVRPGYLREVLAEAVGHPELADWRAVDPELDARRWRETQDLLRVYLQAMDVPLV